MGCAEVMERNVNVHVNVYEDMQRVFTANLQDRLVTSQTEEP